MYKLTTITAVLVLLCSFVSFGLEKQNNKEVEFKARFTSKHLKQARAKLIPFPQEVVWKNEKQKVNFVWFADYAKTSKLLRDEAFRLFTDNRVEFNRDAQFKIDFKFDNSIAKEGYWLDVTKEQIVITASTETGHYYGLKTLAQLFEYDQFDSYVELCNIKDYPKFEIRGYMNDVGRNYQSIEGIKKHLDILAQYKMNVFHFHLTDHPAWRIESKVFPQLNLPKNCRSKRDPGFYYTFDELRDIIRYAKERKIMVIPELDMPGHSAYFKETFGYKMESEQGMVALEALLNEFFNEIPLEMAPYIHLGSDEVHVHNPVEFVNKMVSIVEGNNRKAIIWHPGLKASKSVIRQVWGGKEPLPASGLTDIDSDMNYINVGEPMSHIPSLFLKPIGNASNNNTIGGIICLWHDVNAKTEHDLEEKNPLLSSLLTYSWVTWTGDVVSSPNRYHLQIPERGTEAFAYFEAFEDMLLFHKEKYFKHSPFLYHKQCNKEWKLIGPFEKNDGDALVIAKEQKSYNYKGKKIAWKYATGNTIMFNHSWKKGTHYDLADDNTTFYAVTYIKSDKDRDVPAWLGFQSSSRNYKTRVGLATDGNFDTVGSKIWINGKEQKGPKWHIPLNVNKKWDRWKVREIGWNNEEFYWLRKPTTIHLKKGLNRIVIKAPHKYKKSSTLFNFTVLDETGLVFDAK